ncbi:phosphatase PAP2-related protein [Spirosoma utsteinense]|uniref:Sphingomyelin synthase-like domain-containing protein n=1 Tax=Spirosoma utsteinense TaxID=2585773 RepID=A0ABR6WC98_9BACT|nr:phosphatase PAP2-related protein [Spirosoma utsteinense]MBC3788228.1 hypothetical protein [Spirosoma utsteinense]MBC3794189.1 hypothetical protein [Spirosoma utsteinense]
MGILSPDPTGDLAWRSAWRHPVFRWKLFLGLLGVGLLLATFTPFFQSIERHTGPVLNDWLLDQLPPRDVSLGIFLTIWAAALLILFRARKSPAIFMLFIYGYILVSLARMLTINLFPLNPPTGLIPLVDPLSNAFYGKTYITKDLFFSGHTSSILLIFLSLRRWWDRLLVLIGSCLVGSLLLVQHVHYTIDVVGAFVLTYPLYWLGKRIALSGWNEVEAPEKQNDCPN